MTVLHPAELFPPVAVDPFLQASQLEQRLPDWQLGPGDRPDTGSAADGRPAGCTGTAGSECWRLDVPTCTPASGIAALGCYRNLERSSPETNVVYGAVLRAGSRIVLG